MEIRAIYIGSKYKERTLNPSNQSCCELLGCEKCQKDSVFIEGYEFGIVHESNPPEGARVSGINIYGNPEILGDFIIYGIKNNRLKSLSEQEVKIIKQHTAELEGRYILCDID